MMINKRLIGTVAESKKYIAGNVVLQWCSLAANIAMMFSISKLLAGLYYGLSLIHIFQGLSRRTEERAEYIPAQVRL